jgi:hypothetical protein
VSPVKYELGLYIPEDGILHNDCCENLKPQRNALPPSFWFEGFGSKESLE